MRFFLLGALLGPQLAAAHMLMSYPPGLRYEGNPFTTDVDYDMTSPLSADGSNFPCKGYQSLLQTPQGQPVATFEAGRQYNFTIAGGAYHNGGSCQASISVDDAKTFYVVQSFIGNCPLSSGGSFDFTVPDDVPSHERALFAWTWFNNEGNREMYMNCASVNLSGASSSARRRSVTGPAAAARRRNLKRASSVGFFDRPTIFVANVGNGCGTTEGTDVVFPSPGPDVTRDTSHGAPPTGTCPSTAGNSSSGNASVSGSTGASSTVGAPSSSVAASSVVASSAAVSASVLASSATSLAASTFAASSSPVAGGVSSSTVDLRSTVTLRNTVMMTVTVPLNTNIVTITDNVTETVTVTATASTRGGHVGAAVDNPTTFATRTHCVESSSAAASTPTA